MIRPAHPLLFVLAYTPSLLFCLWVVWPLPFRLLAIRYRVFAEWLETLDSASPAVRRLDWIAQATFAFVASAFVALLAGSLLVAVLREVL